MRQFSAIFGRLFVLLCCTFPAFATTRVVGPLNYPTIQSAINASTDGDTVLVNPGTYYENIDFLGKSLTVTSTLSTDSAAIALATSTTIIDGSSKAPAVTIEGPYNGATLSYFTIQHGGASSGGQPTSSYGGVYASSGSPLILGNIITGNNFGGVLSPDTSAQIVSNTISQNTCWGVVGAAVTVTGNEISKTATPALGCTLSNSRGTFTTNSTGLLLLPSPSYPNSSQYNLPAGTVTGNTIENNVQVAASGAPVEGGAGIVVYGGADLIQNNVIRNNSAPAGRGGAIDVVASGNTVIYQNLLYGNHAGCGGAAIAFDTASLVGEQIHAVTIFYFFTHGLVVANNTIADNVDDANAGCLASTQIAAGAGGVGSAEIVFVNNIITGDGSAPAMACEKTGSTLASQAIFDHNVLYNAGSAFFGTSCIDESSNGLLGNIVAQPQFTNRSAGNYTLAAGSPGIDAGNNSIFEASVVEMMTVSLDVRRFDLAGNTRVQNATGKTDGSGAEEDIIDMGAYEYAGNSAPKATAGVFMQPTGYTSEVGNGVLTAFVNTNLGISPFEPAYLQNCCLILSDTPTGTLTFFIDGVQLVAPANVNNALWQEKGQDNAFYPMTSGLATVPVFFLPGTHVLSATFQPEKGVTTASSIPVVINITGEATHLLLEANPLNATLGTPVTFTVYGGAIYGPYIPSPVTLFDYNTKKTLATINLDPTTGMGSFTTTSPLPGGPNVFQASFAGSGIYEASLSNEVSVFQTSPTSLSVSSSLNPAYALVPFTLTGQLSPVPTFAGQEIMYFYAPAASGVLQQIGSGIIDASGKATASVSLPAGTYNITAGYNGDEYYGASTSPVLVEKVLGSGTSVTVSSGLNPAIAFQAIPLQAHVSTATSVTPGSITGTVSFLVNGTTAASGTVDVNGDATASVSLPAGSYSIVASYSGDGSFSPSQSAALQEKVNPDSTVTTLTVTPNPGYTPNESETFTATVSAVSSATVPTGTLTFYDNFNGTTTALMGLPVGANGQILFTTGSLAAGVHSITAGYSGDSNFQASSSGVVSLTIILRDFVLSTPPSLTIQTQHHASFPVTLTSTGNFVDSVSITCSSLPDWATCNFTSGSIVALGGDATATATIDIDTDAILNFASNTPDHSVKGWRGGVVFAFLLPMLLISVRKRSHMRLLVVLLGFGMAVAATGCSGLYPHHTAPGTYAVTLTGKGASTGRTHTATFNLIVTP